MHYFTIKTERSAWFATLWLTLPSNNSLKPPLPRLPIINSLQFISFAVSISFFAALPSCKSILTLITSFPGPCFIGIQDLLSYSSHVIIKAQADKSTKPSPTLINMKYKELRIIFELYLLQLQTQRLNVWSHQLRQKCFQTS